MPPPTPTPGGIESSCWGRKSSVDEGEGEVEGVDDGEGEGEGVDGGEGEEN